MLPHEHAATAIIGSDFGSRSGGAAGEPHAASGAPVAPVHPSGGTMIKVRNVFRLLSALALAALLAGSTALAQQSLKIGVYGGYFKDSFDEHIFPLFTEETGIEVESIAEPTGEAWYVQLEAAARAGQATADVSMIAQVPFQRGAATGLWAPLDESAMPNLQYARQQLLNRNADGELIGVGRSEEHTSELQSRPHLVCRLLLEKK